MFFLDEVFLVPAFFVCAFFLGAFRFLGFELLLLCCFLRCCFIPISVLKVLPHTGHGTATASSSMFFPRSSFWSRLMMRSPSLYVSFFSVLTKMPNVRLKLRNSFSSLSKPTWLTTPWNLSSMAISAPYWVSRIMWA